MPPRERHIFISPMPLPLPAALLFYFSLDDLPPPFRCYYA